MIVKVATLHRYGQHLLNSNSEKLKAKLSVPGAFCLLVTLLTGVPTNAQDNVELKERPGVELKEGPGALLGNWWQRGQSDSSAPSKWYETISLRGYAQLRYNRLFETNSSLGCEQCDRSWGENGGFFFRRIRLILFGQISRNIYFYIQPDFASSAASDRLHFGQIRDAYFDIGLDSLNEFRFRIGQSKVPFGFENLQSSQNRLPLDRNDALNSAVANERDLGIFFYWAPKKKRELFSELVRKGLKGSGDYGVVGIGLHNGQTANSPESNNSPHVVSRVSLPIKVGRQIIEPGLQAYTGDYVLSSANLSREVKVVDNRTYLDQRVAGTFVWYPQPFGVQTEYNVGRGPEFNPRTDSIETQRLHGGYFQMMYQLQTNRHILFPFVRYQYYDGGKKHERDARSYTVKEFEIGVEWQPAKYFEIVAMYTFSDRRYEDALLPVNRQSGRLLRLQAQINF
jgi:hypothetical protein